MWLKDYGISTGETIRIRLEKIYRNTNGKPVAEAVTTEDETRIQFNIKEEYYNLPKGVYNLTCNNKGNNGFPFVELSKSEDFLTQATKDFITKTTKEVQPTNKQHKPEPESKSPAWSSCNTWLDDQIRRTREKLMILETISKEWKLK